MFAPKYTISNTILKYISTSDAAKEMVEYIPLDEDSLKSLQQAALLKTIYHNVHLEGNQMTPDAVQTVLAGQPVAAENRDLQEVVNLRNVVQFIDHIVNQIGPGNPYVLSLDTISELHRLMTTGVLTAENSGHFRVKQVVVRNASTGEISYTPPPAAEVIYLMEDLVNWINDPQTHQLHPIVKMGLIHFEIARIHPYVDTNYRLARMVALLVLYLDGYVLKKGFSLESHFDQDPMQYYMVLQSVFSQEVIDEGDRNINPWLEYFLQLASVEFTSLKEQIVEMEQSTKSESPGKFLFNDRQMKIIEFLQHNQLLRNRDFEKIFPDYSDDTVLREIKFLKENNVIKKIGGTKNAAYVLA